MLLWLERYVLPICAAIVFGLFILNPFKLDWQQRLSLIIAVSAFAYFLAHTIHKPKLAVAPESDQRLIFLERQVESLQSQQKQLTDQRAHLAEQKQRRSTVKGQLAEFLKEGKTIQHGIHYSNPGSLRQKQTWEHKVEDYLKKNLDESYAVRFTNPSHQVSSYPTGININMAGPWGDVGGKMAMLNDFISELRD